MRITQAAVLAVAVVAASAAAVRGAVDVKTLEGNALPAGAVWMETLDIRVIDQGFGRPQAKRSVDRHPLTLHGEVFTHGVGSHVPGEVRFRLNGSATRFVSAVGIDDETGGKGSAQVSVVVDGKEVAKTGVLQANGDPEVLDIDLTGAKEMVIEMTEVGGIDYGHLDFGGAYLGVVANATEKPQIVAAPVEDPITLPRTDADGALHVVGARVIGGTPGRPFVFKIAALGSPELKYSAQRLPEGLTLDSATGVISGSLKAAGVSAVEVKVEQAGLIEHLLAPVQRTLVIVGGEHKLSLTPPMGWNSWNCFAREVSQDKVKAAADEFVSTGLAAHGFAYVNIDDCWEAKRDAQGMIQANQKFPDMKALSEYIHAKGLKFGIYSSPGPKTCAGFEASYQHEDLDAKQWANWGVDYVKYDLCSFGKLMKNVNDPAELKSVYGILRGALDKAPRDIVYSLCEYGDGKVWEWGADAPVQGNLWRTTGDITDVWGSMAGIGFRQTGHEQFAGPGHWNDPDMLVVGRVGWGNTHPSRLTQNEQLTHISLWSILAAPMLIGCDLTQMDDFTKSVLMNDEVLAVDQDPLGRQGYRVDQGEPGAQVQVYKRQLWDGTVAVGLFNLGRTPTKATAEWSDLGLSGEQPVRDLWQLKNVGMVDKRYTVEVPRHGCVLIKVGKPVSEDEAVKRLVAIYQK